MPDNSPANDALLDALTQYIADRLSGDALVKLVHEEVGHALAAAQQLTLAQVVTARQVSGAAIKYALEWRIEGTLSELAGDIASRVHGRLVEDAAATEADLGLADIADKVVSLPAFNRLVDLAYHSPLIRSAATWFLYRMAVDTVRRNGEIAASVPGVGSLLRLTDAVGRRVLPGGAHAVGSVLREALERAVSSFVTHSQVPDMSEMREPVVEAAARMFADQAAGSLLDLGSAINPQEIEDLLVLGFEVWDDLRRTRSLRAAVEEGVAVFFARYSQHTLADLLDEIGVTREDMIEEALRFAPRALGAVQDNGMLENFIRRQFRDFTQSEQVRALLK